MGVPVTAQKRDVEQKRQTDPVDCSGATSGAAVGKDIDFRLWLLVAAIFLAHVFLYLTVFGAPEDVLFMSRQPLPRLTDGESPSATSTTIGDAPPPDGTGPGRQAPPSLASFAESKGFDASGMINHENAWIINETKAGEYVELLKDYKVLIEPREPILLKTHPPAESNTSQGGTDVIDCSGSFFLGPRPQPLRLFDFTRFNAESDMLEIRMHEMSSVVDKFVIYESNTTDRGYPRSFFFERIKDLGRFGPFLDRIEYIKDQVSIDFRNPPKDGAKWIGHFDWTRVAPLIQGLLSRDGSPDEDVLVYSSDVDEIMPKEVLQQFKSCTPSQENVGFYTTGFDVHLEHVYRWEQYNGYWVLGPNILRLKQGGRARAAFLNGLFPLATGAHLMIRSPWDYAIKRATVAEGGDMLGFHKDSDLLDPQIMRHRYACWRFDSDKKAMTKEQWIQLSDSLPFDQNGRPTWLPQVLLENKERFSYFFDELACNGTEPFF